MQWRSSPCVVPLLCAGVLGFHQHEAPTTTTVSAEEIARVIANLPSWPLDRDLTKGEWSLYVIGALALQQTPPPTIKEALDTYTMYARRFLEPSLDKPVLLLRVAFEIPEDFLPATQIIGVQICGGLVCTPVEGDSPPRNLAAPVAWTDTGPRLTAFWAPPMAFSGGSPRLSVPSLEYAYFKRKFPFRSDLERFVPGQFDGWVTLRDQLGTELTERPKREERPEEP